MSDKEQTPKLEPTFKPKNAVYGHETRTLEGEYAGHFYRENITNTEALEWFQDSCAELENKKAKTIFKSIGVAVFKTKDNYHILDWHYINPELTSPVAPHEPAKCPKCGHQDHWRLACLECGCKGIPEDAQCVQQLEAEVVIKAINAAFYLEVDEHVKKCEAGCRFSPEGVEEPEFEWCEELDELEEACGKVRGLLRHYAAALSSIPATAAKEERDYTPEEALAEARKRWGNEKYTQVGIVFNPLYASLDYTVNGPHAFGKGTSFRAAFAQADAAEKKGKP